MTLSTNVYVLDPIDVDVLFTYCQSLLTEYDDDRRPPDQQQWHDEVSAYRGDGVRYRANRIGQGLPGILDITYREDGPLATAEQAAAHTEDCAEAESDCQIYHDVACWCDVDFDTAYSAQFEGGMGCGDLHAVLVAKLGQWLDAKNIRWKWRNEFTSEVHEGYDRLIELCTGGFEATSWFQATVMPAIAAHVASGEAGQ